MFPTAQIEHMKNPRLELHRFPWTPLQSPLFSIQPVVQDVMKKAWYAELEKQEKQGDRRVKKTSERLTSIILNGQQCGNTWTNTDRLLELLHAPIGRHEPSELDIQPAPEELVEKLCVDDLPKTYDWSDEEMVLMHEHVLIYSLNVLKTRGNATEKLEILDWIWADEIYTFVTKNVMGVDRQIPIRTDQVPFSFETCCRLNGYRSEELQEGIGWAIKDLMKSTGFRPGQGKI